MLRLLCAVLAAAFLASRASASTPEQSGQTASGDATTVEMLQKGGFVLVMRHGKSPHDQIASIGMTEECKLAPGRGLSAEGLAEARMIGAWLAENEIPILIAYTSDLCRSWDTARLAAGGAETTPHPSQKTTDPQIIAAFKREIETELTANPSFNIMLVSHSNIAPLYGARVCSGETDLPEGIVSVVSFDEWKTIARILPDGTVTACNQSVD